VVATLHGVAGLPDYQSDLEGLWSLLLRVSGNDTRNR